MTVKPTKWSKNHEAEKKTKTAKPDEAGYDSEDDDFSSYSSEPIQYNAYEPDLEDMITQKFEKIQSEVSQLRQAQEEGQKKIVEDLSKLVKEQFESHNGERRMEREEKNKAKKAGNMYGDHLV